MDRRIEEMLRKAETSIGDDGFSENVLNRLPKKRLIRTRYRGWTLAAAAATGSILTLLLAPPIEFTLRTLEVLDRYQAVTYAAFLFLAVLLVPAAWILCSHFAADTSESSHPRMLSPFRGRMPKF